MQQKGISESADRAVELLSNIPHVIKSLSYFDDADIAEMPVMIEKVQWQNVKKYFDKEAIRLAEKYL